ncbi:MAG TPA: GumC family protein [Negativicutes bacterium]|jgi:uncharacterized protein involved in exopolysaccharide biosynthesis
MENNNPDRDKQATGLKEFLTIIFKFKVRILAVFLSVVVAATIATFLVSPVYEADSSILVKIGREYVNRPEVGNLAPVMSLSQEEVTNSEIQILSNRDLIQKVIEAIKVENIYPELLQKPLDNISPLDAAIAIFQKKMSVEGIKKSNVIQVTFQHKDPRVAAKALNLLVDFYKEKHLQVFSDPKSSFLESQLVAYDQKLKESETNLQSYKQKAGVFSLEEQRSLLLKQRSELDTALKNTQNIMYEMQKRIYTLKEQMKKFSESTTRYTSTERDKIIVETKARLLALQLNEQALSKKYTETNRLVVNARKEIQTVKDFLKEQEEDISNKVKTGNSVYQNTEMDLIKAETELNAQKGKASAVNQQLSEVNRSIRALEFSEKNILQLKREQTINEKNFQTYMEKAEEARITEDMNRLKMSNISIIQKATVPVEPVKPKKALNILMGIIMGIFCGIGLALISEITCLNFSTPEKVENRLSLPVLATIAQKEG